MDNENALCPHGRISGAVCIPCAEAAIEPQPCPHHGKVLCDECNGMDLYGPTAYTTPKAWGENGKADPMGMAMYFFNELAREKRETKSLRAEIKILLQMLKEEELS